MFRKISNMIERSNNKLYKDLDFSDSDSSSEKVKNSQYTPMSVGNIPVFDDAHSPQNIAIFAFILGNASGIGLASCMFLLKLQSSWWALGCFLFFSSVFHLLEYVCTAIYNPKQCTLDSFLINHSTSHKLAMLLAFSEFIIESIFAPKWKSGLFHVQVVGVLVTIAGQIVRTLAMHTAGSNFSHQIATNKAPDHTLVTVGIYSWLRHPSYTGFYYWSLGTQLILINPVSLLIFLVLLAKFFGARIEYEEATLLRFFGEKYKRYKSRTRVLMLY